MSYIQLCLDLCLWFSDYFEGGGGGEGGEGVGELIHLLNSLMMEVPAIKKPVYWFALLMKELNSLEKKFGDKT